MPEDLKLSPRPRIQACHFLPMHWFSHLLPPPPHLAAWGGNGCSERQNFHTPGSCPAPRVDGHFTQAGFVGLSRQSMKTKRRGQLLGSLCIPARIAQISASPVLSTTPPFSVCNGSHGFVSVAPSFLSDYSFHPSFWNSVNLMLKACLIPVPLLWIRSLSWHAFHWFSDLT